MPWAWRYLPGELYTLLYRAFEKEHEQAKWLKYFLPTSAWTVDCIAICNNGHFESPMTPEGWVLAVPHWYRILLPNYTLVPADCRHHCWRGAAYGSVETWRHTWRGTAAPPTDHGKIIITYQSISWHPLFIDWKANIISFLCHVA